MAANTSVRLLCLIFSLLASHGLGATVPSADFSDQAMNCSQRIRERLRESLANSPKFATIHDAARWLEQHLPGDIRERFTEAGREVSRSLIDWEKRGMIKSPFWNAQALSELLIAQSRRFNGIAGCSLRDDLGVTREILEDQIYVLLDLKNRSVETMDQLGVSEANYMKRAVMYGLILDFATVTWKDDQIARLVKFRLDPSDDLQ